MREDRWDAVIVGGGVAGLSAALMLGRSRRTVLIIDEGRPRNRFSGHMQAVLGHDGADPASLLTTGRAEVARYGVEFTAGTVERIDEDDDGVRIALAGDSTAVRARRAILASGLRDELPAIPGLAERWGATVLHCPYCHGWEVRDRRFGVLGGSALSWHQAELVRQWSDDVVVFTAGLDAVDPAVEGRLRSRGVRLEPAPVVEVIGDAPGISGVRTEDGRTIPVDAIFAAPRLTPHDGSVAHLGLERADNPMGSFLAVDATGKTSSDRIWAAGNVVNPGANVPMASSAGTVAGSAVNAALVAADFDAAMGALAEVGHD